MSLQLTGKQIQGLQRALMSAYPDRNKLEQVVLFELDENLNHIAGAGPLPDVVFALIQWAKAQGRMEDLVVGAQEGNKGNPDLKAFLAEVGLYSDTPPEPGGKLEGQLEAIVVAGVPFQDVAQWRHKMRHVEAAVCMVEDSQGTGWGTGFLVAKDVVMTNEHVSEKLKQQGGTPQVRFGYIRGDAGPGADNGVVVPMVDDGWELVTSPPDQLDYALLRLKDPAAEQIADGERRGFLTPSTAYRFKKDEPIFIVQHPQRDPLALGAGYLKDVNQFMKRIAYTTNTEQGSSGSPCFSMSWDLIALHHHGDQFTNHGTPMKYIVEHLKEQGKATLLG